jgi:hypothetical protein
MSSLYQKNKEAIYRWRENNPEANYECNKPHIYKWRLNNPDKHKELCKISQRKYEAKKRNWKSIRTVYFNILLE